MAIKFGVVGLGWPGQQHVKAIGAFPEEAVLTAVCDMNPALLAEFEGLCATFGA